MDYMRTIKKTILENNASGNVVAGNVGEVVSIIMLKVVYALIEQNDGVRIELEKILSHSTVTYTSFYFLVEDVQTAVHQDSMDTPLCQWIPHMLTYWLLIEVSTHSLTTYLAPWYPPLPDTCPWPRGAVEEPDEDDEDPEEDPADYPADGDDDDDDNEDKDEDEDEEDEEEHPAPADFVPPVHHYHTTHLPIPSPPPNSPTYIEIPESCLPLRKRVRFASPTPSPEIAPTTIEWVNQRVTNLATIVEEETTSMYEYDKDERLDGPEDWGLSMDASDYAHHRRQRVISELLASDHKRQVQLTKTLRLLKGLQTQMVEFQRQHGPAKGPAQPDAPGEAGSSS
ncbi:hypothetical protein Tco_1229961 [Tanacetum coccineum]